jgi:hypothetical protein
MRVMAPAPLGAPAEEFADAAPQAREPVVVLGVDEVQPTAWWLDPILTLLFLLIPLFCFAAYYNQFNFAVFNSSENFVTPETFRLGLFSAGLLIFGMMLAKGVKPRVDHVVIAEARRVDRVLLILAWVSIGAHLLYMGAVLVRYDLIFALLRGDVMASYDLRDFLGRIPGITSLLQFGVVYMAMVSALWTLGGVRFSTQQWTLTAIVFGLYFARSILASERLALLEALAALLVAPAAFKLRPSALRAAAPYIGSVFVFLAFAAGEYLRSWQAYRGAYGSYAEFIVPRFFGYFSTSVNNGAGTYLLFGKFDPAPQQTVTWITRFPGLGRFFERGLLPSGSEDTLLNRYLETFGSPEFNSPGGLYAAFYDYPFVVACVFMVFIGFVIGWLFRSFVNRTLWGLLLYPVIFLGMTDLIRNLYITGTRTLPIFLGGVVAAWALRAIQVPRDRLAAPEGAGDAAA